MKKWSPLMKDKTKWQCARQRQHIEIKTDEIIKIIVATFCVYIYISNASLLYIYVYIYVYAVNCGATATLNAVYFWCVSECNSVNMCVCILYSAGNIQNEHTLSTQADMIPICIMCDRFVYPLARRSVLVRL